MKPTERTVMNLMIWHYGTDAFAALHPDWVQAKEYIKTVVGRKWRALDRVYKSDSVGLNSLIYTQVDDYQYLNIAKAIVVEITDADAVALKLKYGWVVCPHQPTRFKRPRTTLLHIS